MRTILQFFLYFPLMTVVGPFLQNPAQSTMHISWITQDQQSSCQIEVLNQSAKKSFPPVSSEMTYMESWWVNTVKLENLQTDTTYHYQLQCDQKIYGPYEFSTAPDENMPVTLLLLSDHQQKPMIHSTFEAIETYMQQNLADILLFAGDFVAHPNNPEEWFFNAQGNGFFETMTQQTQILQYVPLFPSIGNHEVTGYGAPGKYAEQFYAAEPASWNTVSYEEIFTLPPLPSHVQKQRQNTYHETDIATGPEAFYAFRFGNTFIISLFVTRKWVMGDHQQKSGATYEPQQGTGRFIFEPIKSGSIQYTWLQQQLKSSQSQTAEARIIFFHHPVYSQGQNIFPPFGEVYHYEEDYLVHDLVPLFEQYQVNLVYYGHNHIVNHFQQNSVHYLESSNIGNSYGAYAATPEGKPAPEPHGLKAEIFIGDNHNSYFTVVDTDKRQVTIYKVNNGKIISNVHQFSLD